MGDESSSDFVGLNHDDDEETDVKQEHIPALITPDHTVTVGRRKVVLVDSQPIAVDESASKQAEKSTVTWRLVVDGIPITVTVVHSQLGGKRQVYADGVLVHESRRFFDIGSSHEFDVVNKGKPTRKFLVRIYWRQDSNPPGYAYALSIDGRGVANAENVAVEETKGLTSPLSENDIREAEALKAKEAEEAATHTDATEAPPLPGAAPAKVEADHSISAVAAAPPPSAPTPAAPAPEAAPAGVPGRRKSVVLDERPVEVTESTTRQRQKNIITWKLTVDGTPWTISVKHNQLTGKRQVFLDQALLHESRKFFDTGSHHEFDLASDGKPNRKIVVDIVWGGGHGKWCFTYKLSIDGKPLSDAEGVTVEDAKGVSVLPSENEIREAETTPTASEAQRHGTSSLAETAPAPQDSSSSAPGSDAATAAPSE